MYSPELNETHLRLKAALIFFSVFLLYFFTLSPGLDEWDSVQFAMGVRHFDLWQHQPHPPGYPLYVFFGWIGQELFRLDPALSLQCASCIGGGIFVACWFLIIRRQFSERFAWLIAGSLTITPIVWMTSTKTMTDSLATGLLSAQLLSALIAREKKNAHHLLGAALFGAAATGVRPQLFAVALAIILLSLGHGASRRKRWLAFGAYVGGCLLWLFPMWYLQASLSPGTPAWQVYPAQVYSQWKWRLHRPNIYIGAGDWSAAYLGERFAFHIFGWLGVGLGFMRSGFTLALGFLIFVAGLAFYFRRLDEEDRVFWRAHRGWAALHVAIIFCCLPAHQRYYLIIMPLVLVVLSRGLLRMPGKWRAGIVALPALLLWISIPIALKNMREEAPPLRFARYFERHYSLGERPNILLLLTQTRRHVQWYAPGFQLAPPDPIMSEIPREQLAAARAIYTDDPKLALTPGWRLDRVALFHRSLLIASKHRKIGVYKLERIENSP